MNRACRQLDVAVADGWWKRYAVDNQVGRGSFPEVEQHRLRRTGVKLKFLMPGNGRSVRRQREAEVITQV